MAQTASSLEGAAASNADPEPLNSPKEPASANVKEDPDWSQLTRVSVNDDHEDLEEICFYDEVDLDEMDYEEEDGLFTYMCPCGDLFSISEEELVRGQEAAYCPSCTLVLRVMYTAEDIEEFMPEPLQVAETSA
eukprot:TRINITY_DN5215_c0_g1_i1.p1 TRINITY_DN5215_c0_g1~~TRINITY_DN5215_c0_g1_i1.p1  ORF type:complete len:134 (-),score=32.97 TRINITY_DN5215_c0_g1_i1:221-622(-)